MERSRTEHGWVWMVASWPPARRKASGLWGIRAMLFFFLIFSAGAMFSKKQQQKSRTWKLRTLINSTFFGGLLSVLKAQVLYITLRGCEIFGPKSFTKVQMWTFLFFFCLGGGGKGKAHDLCSFGAMVKTPLYGGLDSTSGWGIRACGRLHGFGLWHKGTLSTRKDSFRRTWMLWVDFRKRKGWTFFKYREGGFLMLGRCWTFPGYIYIYIYMGSGRFPGPMELLLQQLVRVSKTRWRWFNLNKSMLLQPLIKKLEVLVMINQWTTYCINDNNDERWMVVLIDFYLTVCKN